MLMTDMILLLAMATSPTPRGLVAASGCGGDQAGPGRRLAGQSAASAAASRSSAYGRDAGGCGLKEVRLETREVLSRVAGTGSANVLAGSGTEDAGSGKATTTDGFAGAWGEGEAYVPAPAMYVDNPRRPHRRLRSWCLHPGRVRASSGSQARTSGAMVGTSGPRVAGNPNAGATTGGRATGIATAADRRGIRRAGSTAIATTANMATTMATTTSTVAITMVTTAITTTVTTTTTMAIDHGDNGERDHGDHGHGDHGDRDHGDHVHGDWHAH